MLESKIELESAFELVPPVPPVVQPIIEKDNVKVINKAISFTMFAFFIIPLF